MGFLSKMFDPGNVFSGDKGDFVGNLLDPVGGHMENFGLDEYNPLADTHDDVNSWMDDIGDSTELLARSRTKNIGREMKSGEMFKRDALTGFTGFGGSPIGTRFTNKVNANEDKPLWDMYGGATPDDYQYGENHGQDMSNQRGLDAAGQAVGKGFLNAFTFGLGSTALDGLNSYGYGDDEAARNSLKGGAKTFALNYLGLGDVTGGSDVGGMIGAGDYAPLVNGVVRGASNSATSAALNGSNRNEIGQAAATGGVTGGVRSGVGMAGNYLRNAFAEDMPDTGSLGGTMTDSDGESSATLGGVSSNEQIDANRQAYGAGGMSSMMSLPTSNGREQAMSVGQSAGPSSSVSDFIASITGGGGLGNYGDLAASAFGMYNANRQRKKLQEQQSNLQNLFSPNSPYAQMARQKMERQDAAGGRRSQYGNREVQLAALLADRQAQTMPQQQKYADAIGGYDNMMVNAGLRGAGQLYNMYKPQQQPRAFGLSGIPFRLGDD